jgi:hypothetical protein
VPTLCLEGEYPASAPAVKEKICRSLSANVKSRGGHLDNVESLVLNFQLGCSVYPSRATNYGRVLGEQSAQADG